MSKLYWQMPAPLEADLEVLECREEEGRFHLRCEPGLFYPESGGQRSDRGTLGGHRVLDCYTKDGADWLILDADPGVGKHPARVDADLRRDHAEQHSAQHLLSGLAFREFDIQTLSFHMGEDVSTLELDHPPLPEDRLRDFEDRAAALIRRNLIIEALYPENEDWKKLPLRRPPQVSEGVRVLHIQDLDHAPCGGTHLSSTAEIGSIRILRQEKIRGHLRLEFLAGERARQAGRRDAGRIAELSRLFQTGSAEVPERAEGLISECRDLRREVKKLKESVLKQESRELEQEEWLQKEGWEILLRDFGERSPGELDALSRELCAEPGRLLLLSSRQGDQLHVLAQRSRGEGPSLGSCLGEVLRERDGRGGGGEDRAQGVLSFSNENDVLVALLNGIFPGEDSE
ncbi:MAG: alanyl-tRNA editing protein [Candidatus Krumholzibacteria bacterium]|nr:alanyl-tRNA editing protein [Candidatus Krumholzibacteria bacterium]MDP6669188.1 alanyl-tRNA editing protein [Candidatus Krumholzibacteria bacterium]MDP6798060.1 alanyl-tRNA editing protein [Candidatus Krumholzibacteria bacterium]MDP7021252.1 alanyl-tRNA editing protein [Candidatus Krumholzibacteria bacterium]